MTANTSQYEHEMMNDPAPPADTARSQVLSNLLQASTYLVSTLDPTELIHGLLQRVVGVVPAVQAGLLWMYDSQRAVLQIEATYGIEAVTDTIVRRIYLRAGEGIAGSTIRREDPLLIETRTAYRDLVVRAGVRWQNDITEYLESLPCTIMAVSLPLRIGNEIIGVLELLNFGSEPPLQRDDVPVLQAFSNIAAGAIKNAQLHAQMQAHQRRLEAFGAIGTVVSTAADLSELTHHVLDVMLGVVGADAGALLLLDPGRAMLLCSAANGLPDTLELLHEIPVVGAVCEEAVRYGQPIRRPLLERADEARLIEHGFAGCAYIPLLAGGTVVGIAAIYGESRLPQRIDVQTLMMMSNLIGFAIANVRLYEDSQTERRKLAAVINSIAEGVGLCDRAGRLVLANQTAMALLSIESLPYQQPLSEMPDFYAIRDLDSTPLPVERLPFARALSGEVFHDYRVLLRGASGQDTVMGFSGAPVYDDMGHVEGAVVVFRDITASQRLERAKDDFLAVAAHELRSPLAAVRSYTDLLVRREQRRSDEDSTELRGLTILAQQVGHMLRLVDNLLDVSRLDAGQLTLQMQHTNLISLIEQAIEQLRPTAGERMLSFESELSEHTITCDALRIRQVVTNLISNAIRYSPNSTRIDLFLMIIWSDELALRHPAFAAARQLSALQQAQAERGREPLVLMSVSDQGGGIPADQLQRLFRRFQRGNQRAGEGLGLGLYLSREFVTRHGGEIWAESREHQGSTFYVALPTDIDVAQAQNGTS